MQLHTLRGMKAQDICIAFIEVIFADGVVLYSKRYEGSGLTHCIPTHTLK
jgi:hypothetical protein